MQISLAVAVMVLSGIIKEILPALTAKIKELKKA